MFCERNATFMMGLKDAAEGQLLAATAETENVKCVMKLGLPSTLPL